MVALDGHGGGQGAIRGPYGATTGRITSRGRGSMGSMRPWCSKADMGNKRLTQLILRSNLPRQGETNFSHVKCCGERSLDLTMSDPPF